MLNNPFLLTWTRLCMVWRIDLALGGALRKSSSYEGCSGEKDRLHVDLLQVERGVVTRG